MTSMNWQTYEDVMLRIMMGTMAVLMPSLVLALLAIAYHQLTKACP
jgi:hypothetical protein